MTEQTRTIGLTIAPSYYRGALTWARVPLAVLPGDEPGTIDLTDPHGNEVDEQHVAEKLLAALLDVWTEYGQPTDPIPTASAPDLIERRLRRALGEVRRASSISPIDDEGKLDTAVDLIAEHARALLAHRSGR